jgi:hypothetical protein
LIPLCSFGKRLLGWSRARFSIVILCIKLHEALCKGKVRESGGGCALTGGVYFLTLSADLAAERPTDALQSRWAIFLSPGLGLADAGEER